MALESIQAHLDPIPTAEHELTQIAQRDLKITTVEPELTLHVQIQPQDPIAILHAPTLQAHQVQVEDVLADTAAAEVAAAAEDLAVAVEEDKSN